jgi:hypothetical protein
MDPRPLSPWRAQPFTEIKVEPEREKALANALANALARQVTTSNITVFSDASGKESKLGAIVMALDRRQQIIGSRQINISLNRVLIGLYS